MTAQDNHAPHAPPNGKVPATGDTTTPRLAVQNLVKRFGETLAVRGVSFEVHAGECLALLGPSGCGKTTALRCIAGLEDPTSGQILIEGKPVWSDNGVNVPTHERLLGMMFQSYALWPHLSVADNIEYPLRYHKWPRNERRARVEWALELVGLAHRIDAFPSELSGGQQQRIALARSIVAEPRILLFDEPLANLDRRLRETMRTELRELLDRVGITSIFVTHDQSEAFALADRVAVMRDGVIMQIGSAVDIYRRPEDPFVAAFVGHTNFLPARLQTRTTSAVTVTDTAGATLTLPIDPQHSAKLDEQVALLVRPEHISISAMPFDAEAADARESYYHFSGGVERVLFLGSSYEIALLRGSDKIRIAVLSHHIDEQAPATWLAPGQTVYCKVRLVDLSLLPETHGLELE